MGCEMGSAAKRRDKRKAAKAHTTVRTYLPKPDRTGRAAKPTGWFADKRARLFSRKMKPPIPPPHKPLTKSDRRPPCHTQEPEPSLTAPTGRKPAASKAKGNGKPKPTADAIDDDVIIEYVAAPFEVDENFAELAGVVAAFNKREDGFAATYVNEGDAKVKTEATTGDVKEEGMEDMKRENQEADIDSDNSDGDDTNQDAQLESNKQRKAANRVKIAALKSRCAKPEVVEVWDVTANDPTMLVFLKSCRNTIPVPPHWCQKRAFLSGKRGLEKPPWQLPSFIEATGIQKLRYVFPITTFRLPDCPYETDTFSFTIQRRVRGQGGREETQAERQRRDFGEDGQNRHRLPGASRCFF